MPHKPTHDQHHKHKADRYGHELHDEESAPHATHSISHFYAQYQEVELNEEVEKKPSYPQKRAQGKQ